MTDPAPLQAAEILLIEERADIRRLFERTLRLAGYNPVGTSNLKSALAILRERPFQMLVTEWYLDDGCAEDLIHAFEEACPHAPVLICCASGSGFTWPWPFLAKPFRPSQLVSRIQELLARKESREGSPADR